MTYTENMREEIKKKFCKYPKEFKCNKCPNYEWCKDFYDNYIMR